MNAMVNEGFKYTKDGEVNLSNDSVLWSDLVRSFILSIQIPREHSMLKSFVEMFTYPVTS